MVKVKEILWDNEDSVPQVKKEIKEGGREMKTLRSFHCNKLGHARSQCW